MLYIYNVENVQDVDHVKLEADRFPHRIRCHGTTLCHASVLENLLGARYKGSDV